MLDLFNHSSEFCFGNQGARAMLDSDLIVITHDNNVYLTANNHIPTYGELKALKYDVKHDNLYLYGQINGVLCYCYVDDVKLEHGLLNALSLRIAYQHLSHSHYQSALMANHLTHWLESHNYCGKCGSKNQMRDDEFALSCSSCHKVTYPTISPCIIVLINDGDKVLLAKNKHSPQNIYSCIAGFVNPCENLEHAVEREIMEEVGLKVKNIRYITSQPWPFPHSLMMGFYADYASGTINVDYNELADAQWYQLSELDTINLPSEISIARLLINQYRNELSK